MRVSIDVRRDLLSGYCLPYKDHRAEEVESVEERRRAEYNLYKWLRAELRCTKLNIVTENEDEEPLKRYVKGMGAVRADREL